MALWVYPLGTASNQQWDVSIGSANSPGIAEDWRHTGINVATLGPGETLELDSAEEERIVVPLSGAFAVSTDTQDFLLRGRASVFAGPTDVLYTGTRTSVRVSSVLGGRVAITTAPAKNSYPARLILAKDVPVLMRGAGNCLRQVHNFGMPGVLEADRILVCEVLTPAGNWSSYPPHKHDVDNEGETALEEIYYYETQVAKGSPAPESADAFGYQRVYASDERPIDVGTEVRTGDVVLVPYGWHGPAMAAPGYDLYYLNVMAGPGANRDWLISDDPHHGWIRQVWEQEVGEPDLLFADGELPEQVANSISRPTT